MTKQKWVVTSVAVPSIIALVSLGFDALPDNPLSTVPIWIPSLFFVSAGLLAFLFVCYLAWTFLKRIRFQLPVYITNEQKQQPSGIIPSSKPVKTSPPRRLEHDSVLWEDVGKDGWGYVKVVGPLCPKDFTPLSIKTSHDIQANIQYNTWISPSYYSQLICLECHTEYTLGNKAKQIQASHDEVAIRFTGMRKRERETLYQ
jgi:hypothetical protein